jgi:hypothetical protein
MSYLKAFVIFACIPCWIVIAICGIYMTWPEVAYTVLTWTVAFHIVWYRTEYLDGR